MLNEKKCCGRPWMAETQTAWPARKVAEDSLARGETNAQGRSLSFRSRSNRGFGCEPIANRPRMGLAALAQGGERCAMKECSLQTGDEEIGSR